MKIDRTCLIDNIIGVVMLLLMSTYLAGIILSFLVPLFYFNNTIFEQTECKIDSKYFDTINFENDIQYQIFFNVSFNGNTDMAAFYKKELGESSIEKFVDKDKAKKVYNEYKIGNSYKCFVPEKAYHFTFSMESNMGYHVAIFDYNLDDEEAKDKMYLALMIVAFSLVLIGTVSIIVICVYQKLKKKQCHNEVVELEEI